MGATALVRMRSACGLQRAFKVEGSQTAEIEAIFSAVRYYPALFSSKKPVMNNDRRSHESSGLRMFFDEQLHHLQSLVGSLSHPPVHDEDPRINDDMLIVENFVDAANTKMRAVSGFAEKLRVHVCSLHNHVLQVIEEIPPPVALNRDAFRTDPLVNSLFVNANDIERLFQRTPEVDAYLRTHGNNGQTPVIYALLTVCKNEKSMLGVGMLGDMLVRDVPQQAVNFSLHKIHTPCANSAELSSALRQYLFGRIVGLIKQEMALRMAHQTELGDKSYQGRLGSLANPDVYLNALIEYLEIPAKLLNIEKIHFRLSKLGIKLEGSDRQCANEFDIHELRWRDGTRNVVLQIAYSRQAG
jgi:hypothetical protein